MVLATMISLQTIAQTSKKQLSAVFSYATFQRADGQNYVESYISFDAWNLNFLPQQDGKLRATVQVILQVYKGDSLVDARKNGPRQWRLQHENMDERHGRRTIRLC